MNSEMDQPPKAPRKPWVDRVSAGFALTALILVTVAVVAPEVEAVAGENARTLALADANAIGVALRSVSADAGGKLFAALGASPRWLYGPGVLPRDNAFAREGGFPLSGVLVANEVREPEWRGPYLERVPIDPWGRAYVVNCDASRRDQPVFIVSAGPDGVVNTTPKDGAISGDDAGIILMP
jgi:hypothetical protein